MNEFIISCKYHKDIKNNTLKLNQIKFSIKNMQQNICFISINIVSLPKIRNLMKKSDPKIKAFVLRAPESLLAKLTEIATINDHSLNSYLNSELKKIVAKSKQLN